MFADISNDMRIDVVKTKKSKAELFARKVYNYSHQDTPNSYHDGTRYPLAKFLISPYQGPKDLSPNKAKDPEEGFPFVTVCDLGKSWSSSGRTSHYGSPEKIDQAIRGDEVEVGNTKQHPDVCSESGSSYVPSKIAVARTASAGQIVFLRGFPSPEWLNQVGASLGVDPELFANHMELDSSHRQSYTRLTHYPPSFSSMSTTDLLQIRIFNTGHWDSSRSGLSVGELRSECETSMNKHLEEFINWQNMSVGDSIVRGFTVHDLRHFTIEQRVSVEVIHHNGRWTLLVWMDSGSDLSLNKTGPWLRNRALTWTTTLHPIFQHRKGMALEKVATHAESSHAGASRAALLDKSKVLPQTASHLHDNYGRYRDRELMTCDVFYALGDLFELSATSRGQFLDLMEDKIRTLARVDPLQQHSDGISKLQLAGTILEEHARGVEDDLDVIRNRGGRKWPKATEEPLVAKADSAAAQLQGQHERLLKRYRHLIDQTRTGVGDLMNQQAYNQGEKTIQQADDVMKLTLLAYFFVPLSFTTSLFGMNVVELASGLSVWTWVCAAVATTALSFVFWRWDIRVVYRACVGWVKRKRQVVL